MSPWGASTGTGAPQAFAGRKALLMELPRDDRDLSPYTGYTRAHWEAAAEALLAAVEPYATEDRALYHLPGDRTSWSGRLSDGLEGYARTLLLAAFLRDETALERYADGLAAGVSGIWPRIEDRSQPLVEAASIALALRLTRPLLWDRLDDGVRQRATAWLGDALTAEAWPCNWELFPVTVGGFLQEIGYEADASRAAIDRGLERIEKWYIGDGWYTDGDGRKFDYYNGWAMHLYPVLHAWLADDPELLDLYGGRLARHLEDYARLFGGDGAPMHQGRSLTYRFATTSPLWLGALTGRTPCRRARPDGWPRERCVTFSTGAPWTTTACSPSAGTAPTRRSCKAIRARRPPTGPARASSACSCRRTTRCGRRPRNQDRRNAPTP